MKILELTLQNFLPILTGTGKECIHINLRESEEKITVLIGKIGSGKTYILSHLQPFATVGTLDVRNQDDPILPETDGKKIIIYEKDGHEYVITHDYLWNGKSHSRKSYITKDEVELNETGNTSSFKELIQLEFGIDQSFLQLIRLGANVVNFIQMKATERKAFIASKLQSTETYLLLYKHWSNELRLLNTQATILMNKLNSFGVKSVEEMEEQVHDLHDMISDMQREIDQLSEQKYELQGEIKALCFNDSFAQFEENRLLSFNQKALVIEEISKLEQTLTRYDQYPDLMDLTKTIGKLDQMIQTHTEEAQTMSDTYQDVTTTLHTLKDKVAMVGNQDHIAMLQSSYDA